MMIIFSGFCWTNNRTQVVSSSALASIRRLTARIFCHDAHVQLCVLLSSFCRAFLAPWRLWRLSVVQLNVDFDGWLDGHMDYVTQISRKVTDGKKKGKSQKTVQRKRLPPVLSTLMRSYIIYKPNTICYLNINVNRVWGGKKQESGLLLQPGQWHLLERQSSTAHWMFSAQ